MIRIVIARDPDGNPTDYETIPSLDIERIPPYLCDQVDKQCATIEGFSITCYEEAIDVLAQLRGDLSSGDLTGSELRRRVYGKQARDLALIATWAALVRAGRNVTLAELYADTDGLDWEEISDPVPIPTQQARKQAQDRKGKAKAGSASRHAVPA